MTRDRWIHERSADGLARFVLGVIGANPLVCFGINPSTAVPNAPDRTIARVSRFAVDNGYDSWTMLNVYPQIATDPKNLDREYQPGLKAENERHISGAIDGRPATLLAAWGGLIAFRPYLRSLLTDILQLTSAAGCDWVSLGEPTKDGHPRHPLYVRADTPPFSPSTCIATSNRPMLHSVRARRTRAGRTPRAAHMTPVGAGRRTCPSRMPVLRS